ncbi:MAG: IS1595 family transposase [Bacteroidota bacterium]
MDVLIKQIDLETLEKKFSSLEDCLQFVADKKWENGFACKKCGHTNFCKGKTPHARRCTRCKHEESATANTIFHRCHIPLTEAFRIVYMVCHDPGISTYEISRQVELRQMTCWKLKSKLMECLKSRGEVDILFHENADAQV